MQEKMSMIEMQKIRIKHQQRLLGNPPPAYKYISDVDVVNYCRDLIRDGKEQSCEDEIRILMNTFGTEGKDFECWDAVGVKLDNVKGVVENIKRLGLHIRLEE